MPSTNLGTSNDVYVSFNHYNFMYFLELDENHNKETFISQSGTTKHSITVSTSADNRALENNSNSKLQSRAQLSQKQTAHQQSVLWVEVLPAL